MKKKTKSTKSKSKSKLTKRKISKRKKKNPIYIDNNTNKITLEELTSGYSPEIRKNVHYIVHNCEIGWQYDQISVYDFTDHFRNMLEKLEGREDYSGLSENEINRLYDFILDVERIPEDQDDVMIIIDNGETWEEKTIRWKKEDSKDYKSDLLRKTKPAKKLPRYWK